MLTAIGGKLTDICGNYYSYHKDVEHPNSRGVFATGKGISHANLIKKIPQDVLDVFP